LAAGVELVEIDTPVTAVEYRKPNAESQSQSDDKGNSNGGWCFLAGKRFAECGVLCQISRPPL
jgi:hypothetical protein